MFVFATPGYYQRFMQPLQSAYPYIVAGNCQVTRFSNGEMQALVHDDVNNQDCIIIGSVAPPDEQLLSLIMLVDALKHGGARSLRVFLPYLGYARQDKFKPGESGGIGLIGGLLRSAGVNEIITIDAHSALAQKLIGIPFKSLFASELFAPSIQAFGWKDMTVVAPDEGAIDRCQSMVEALGRTHRLAYLVKHRFDGIVHLELIGDVGKQVVIVDDVIDSGHTLISACRLLRNQGVEEIIIAVTHGLFTGEIWKQLFGLGVKQLLISDSCPEALRQMHPNIRVVSLNPLLPAVLSGTAIKEKHYESAVA
jgi:ribose-phosphate pyrophosphokinase